MSDTPIYDRLKNEYDARAFWAEIMKPEPRFRQFGYMGGSFRTTTYATQAEAAARAEETREYWEDNQ